MKKIISTLKFILSIIICNLFIINSVYAQFESPIKGDLKSFLFKVLVVLTAFAGSIFVFMLFYGGILYMTASGNPESEEKAKHSLTWAVIGILIVAMSGAILNYVSGNILQIFK